MSLNAAALGLLFRIKLYTDHLRQLSARETDLSADPHFPPCGGGCISDNARFDPFEACPAPCPFCGTLQKGCDS